MGRAKKAAKGLITGWIQYFLNLLMQVAFVPLILMYAGQETLGAYAIITQMLGYVSLVDFGLSITTLRFLSHAYGKDDDKKEFFQIMSLSRIVLLATNILFALATLGISFWLQELFRFSPDMLEDARACMYMIAFWAIFRSPWVVYAGGLVASQRLATANIIYMVGNISRVGLSLALVLTGYGLKGLIAANIASEIISTALFIIYFHREFGRHSIGWTIRNDKLLKEVFSFSGYILIINLSSLLIFSTGNIIVGSLFGVVAASIFYSTQVPANSGYGLIQMVGKNAAPAINELYGKKDFATLKTSYLNIHKYTNMLSFPFAIGLLLLNRSFISIWAGRSQYGGDLMTGSLACLSVFICVNGVSSTYVQAKGEIKALSRLSFAEGLLNLALSLLLGSLMGMGGVLLAMLIARIPTTAYVSYKSQKDLDVSFHEYMKICVIQPFCISLACGTVLFATAYIIPPNVWVNLIVNVAVFMILYAYLSYRIAMTDEEKSRIKDWVNGLYRLPARV